MLVALCTLTTAFSGTATWRSSRSVIVRATAAEAAATLEPAVKPPRNREEMLQQATTAVTQAREADVSRREVASLELDLPSNAITRADTLRCRYAAPLP